nr:ATP-binding protein [Iningainema tapete]
MDSLEELRVALTELRVAEDQLYQQNQELVKTRAAVEVERQRYQELFEEAPDGYLVTNTEGIIQQANCAAAKLLNISLQFLVGKPLLSFVASSERTAFQNKLDQMHHMERIQEWEVLLCPRQGEPIDAALSVTNVRSRSGNSIALRWLLRDITERKQAESANRKAQLLEATNQALETEIKERQQLEAALRQSEERYRVISELISDYTYVYRVEADGVLIPELLNEAFTRTCGYTVKEMAENGWQSLIHPEDTVIVIQHARLLFSGQSDVFEHRILTKNGEVRWVRNYARPVTDAIQDGVLRIYGAAQDITERKRAESEREELLAREQAARKEAETANQMKDEFLAIVSHELRSPLNAILGWAKLLRTRQFDQKTTAKALDTIERNAQLQTNLIEDLLDISRIIRGKLDLQICSINLVSVIEAAINTVQLAADAKGIRLESLVDSTVGSISGDTDRLQQVVWNLLSNAIKFTPQGGRVEVRLARIDSCVEITVTDTGIGIKPEILPYIFERFRQADSSSTRSHGGLGLGLAIVRHLVELHGGTVHAQSPGEGQGATFTIKLPLPTVKSQ